MTIKTKLTLSALMPLGLLIWIGFVILHTQNVTAAIEHSERMASQVRTKVSFLNASINYYLLHHEEANRIQIQKIDGSLKDILFVMTPDDPYEQELIKNLRYNHNAIGNLLSRLTVLWNRKDGRSGPSIELEERLTGYVLERTKEMTADTIRLESRINTKLSAAHRRASIQIFISVALLSLIIFVVLLLVSKRISTGLRRLQRGTRIVAEGDLDFKISFTRSDELGMLGRAFDEMSERLKAITVSKDRLGQEVGERKRAEEALQQSEERFRTLAEATFEGIAITEAGRILDVNDQFARMIGYEKDELIGMEVPSLVFPEDRPRVLENIEDGIDSTIEHRTVTKDGAIITVEAHGKPFMYRGRGARVTALRDVTDRKRAEADKEHLVAELSREKARWQATVESMLDPVTVCDSEGRATYMNPAYENLVERPMAEDLTLGAHPDYYQIYRPDGTLFSAEDLPLQKAARMGENVCDVEMIQRSSSGREFTAIFSAAPLYDEEGNVSGAVAIGRDVTELRRVERALKETLDDLESRVQARTEELQRAYESLRHETEERQRAEEQLRQAQKMEAIGTLAGGIAHDFNNILAAIIGFTEMAMDDVEDRPMTGKNLQHVMKSAMRARELVKQILTFSRKTSYERSPLELTPVIKETVQLLRASISKTIDIRLSLRTASDMVVASPIEIQQILMNLSTNASLAMQETGGTVEIRLADADFEPDLMDKASGDYVKITVRDTGCGMSPEVVKRIFEPFYTTREVGKGSGMGLAVVYGIVKDLQGTITVESEEEVGSTFRVFLPRVETKAEDQSISPSEIPRGNERILFVDDEEMIVEWGKATLERLGYHVSAVLESMKALKIFTADPAGFDLVITDYAMPHMAGAELSRELLKVRNTMPIILCTGHSERVSLEKAKEIGIREFLMKPLARQELAEAVRRVLDAEAKI